MHAELAKAGIDYKIVTGIDGRSLDFRDPGTSAAVAPSVLTDKVLLPNQIANLFSHLRASTKKF